MPTLFRPPPARASSFLIPLILGCSLSCSAQESPAPPDASSPTGAPVRLASIAPAAAPGSAAKPVAGQQAREQDETQDHSKPAVAAALADGITTGMAVSSGALESNPLVSPTPVGLVALTGVKLGLVHFANTLPEDEKRTALKSTSAIWGGAAVNNVMVLMAAPPPFPLIAGLLMGIVTWHQMEKDYEEQDRKLAARKADTQQAAAAGELPRLVEAGAQAALPDE